MWVVVETYYKHGEYALNIFETREELLRYIYTIATDEYKIKPREWDDLSDDEQIEHIVEIGDDRVANQDGWGVREIRYVACSRS
jgi:hypothetical protein